MNANLCPQCGSTLLADAKGCTKCGFRMLSDAAGGFSGSDWKPSEQQFAVRATAKDLNSWLISGINVDESQVGLLFQNGKFQHEMQPGRHVLETLPERIQNWVTGDSAAAVLIRKGMFPLSLMGEMRTSSGEDVTFHFDFALNVRDRNLFYVNLMHSHNVVTAADLLRVIGPTARQAVVGETSQFESGSLLNSPPQLQQHLVNAVERAISPMIAKWGLSIAYISPLSISSESISAYQTERARLFRDLRDTRLHDEFQSEKDKLEIRRFQESRLKADMKVQANIEEEEREAEKNQTLDQIKHRQDLHKLNLEESRAAAEYEIDSLGRNRKHDREDIEEERSHRLARLNVEREADLLDLTFSLRKKMVEQDQSIDHAKRLHQIAEAEALRDAKLRNLEVTQNAKIANWQFKKKALRSEQLSDSQNQATIEGIQRGTARTEDGKDFDETRRQGDATHQAEAQRLRDLQEIQRNNLSGLLDVEAKRAGLEQDVKQRDHQLSEDAKKNERAYDLERLKTLGSLPEFTQLTEMAKLAADNPAMAPMFGEAMKMAMAKGMTPEQLEMLAAQQSPAVAKALEEKYKAEKSGQQEIAQNQKESYERIIAEIKSANTISQDQVKDILDRVERMGTSGQELLRDVGVSREQAASGNLPPDVLQLLLEALKNKKPW